MTRDETVALFLECEAKRAEARAAALAGGKSEGEAGRTAHEAAKAHWNAWVELLLAERKAMENAGTWKSSREYSWKPEEGENPETQAWLEKAAADFSRCLFLVRGVEGTKETAGEDSEEDGSAKPPVKSIQLEGDRADFSGFVFPGPAYFLSATFSGTANFRSATFSSDAWFNSATFSGTANFQSATFSGDAWFNSATFQNSTSFRKATFEKQANFTGIKVDRAFDMTGAKFEEVPAFNQADFKQAPDLDDVTFRLPDFWPRGDAGLIARYRAIRRMAIQGADYEREQMAFKGELRSRRWTVDKWKHPGTWLGLIYDGIADCGRSIVRPLLIWLASVLVFAVLYLRLAEQAQGFSCGVPFTKALYLAGRNALVLFSGARDARIAQAYQCLYGGDGTPQIPDGVSFIEAFLQVPLSAVLIFLLLLAIKNRFKIK